MGVPVTSFKNAEDRRKWKFLVWLQNAIHKHYEFDKNQDEFE